MRSWLRPSAVLVTLLAVVLIGACAKRPNLTVASAPAPVPPPAPNIAPVVTEPQTTPAPPPAPEPTAPVATAAPAPPPPPPKDFQANSALNPIHFDFDKAEIRPDDARTLDTNANWLREHPDQLVLIEGHCDERGTPAYNLALGDRRAKSTMNYLASRGVSNSRMSIISYGEERPLCTEKTEACWAKNRRAMFLTKER
jgi:peptidoglycan-associated lipoprotein